MKKLFLSISLLLTFSCSEGQVLNKNEVKEDFYKLLNDLNKRYAHLEDKKVNMTCLEEYYAQQISSLKSRSDVLLFFEYILDEFYDSHLILNSNTNASYRLYAPIYASLVNDKAIVTSVWQTQLENLEDDIVGTELISINGISLNDAVANFPTQCSDKSDPEIREWIINKILAGRYNEKRVLTLKLKNGNHLKFDLDALQFRNTNDLVTSRNEGGVAIITINNSLGNYGVIQQFDEHLEKHMESKGLIIDLRNTVDGGDSYMARGIMGRFIDSPRPYQKHAVQEQYDGTTKVERSWVEYVSPRGIQYTKPVIILVGRWTGSMGEGLAIGFEGMDRGIVVGTEMERLAGEMNGFSFNNQSYGYRLSTAKLYHVNGTPRERYIPRNYIRQTTTLKDEILKEAISVIEKQSK